MMNYTLVLLSPFLIYILSKFFINRSILLNFTGDKHQNYTLKEKIPLTGGIFLALYSIIFLSKFEYLSLFILLIFLLGVLSDLKIFNSAKFRFLLQILIVLSFVLYNDLYLQNTKIIIIDQLLNYKTYNYFFVLVCILILLNGTNFIDGLNTNVLGYYTTISLFLYQSNQDFFLINFSYWNLWISILIILFFFNLFNKMFIGDSGSYVLGFIFGYLLIEVYMNNQKLSPFYIILLIWYPCFETLFSIIRKFIFNRSPISPDIFHLHQLLFMFIKKKGRLSVLKSNNISGILINAYNFLILLIGSMFYSNTQYQILLIIFNIFVYCILYFKLFNYLYKNQNKKS